MDSRSISWVRDEIREDSLIIESLLEPDMPDFAGKKVLLTLATTGIGLEAAKQFLAAGATVAINGLQASDVEQAIRTLGETSRLVRAPGDLSSVEGCNAVVDRAVELLGGLDVIVHNACLAPTAYPDDVTEAHWDQVMATNLKAGMFVLLRALPQLRRAKGNVVMVASAFGLVGGPADRLVYAISMGGLVHMASTLAVELGPESVRVNAVCPGYLESETLSAERVDLSAITTTAVPMQRLGRLSEAASAVLYLASDRAGFCTGSILSVDGGSVACATLGGARIADGASGSIKYVPNNS